MFGFVLLAVNTFQLSNITLTTSFGELRWLLVIRGLGLGCTMQPTQLTALGAVPARLRTNASSLNNALRNTVQSFGIALLATIVQTHTLAHAAVLSWQVRGDTVPGLALTQLSGMLQQRTGMAAAGANVAAMGLMLGQIRQQATVLGFADAYSVTFIAAVAAFCLAILLPGRPRGGAARPDPGMMAGGH
jgi:DHA2 family multidrug resistance protein